MGNCASAPGSREAIIPTCSMCGRKAYKPWSDMMTFEKDSWEWKKGLATCKKCAVQQRFAEADRDEEKHWWRRQKEMLYGKAAEAPKIKTITSQKEWKDSLSFREPYRQPSTVHQKLAKLEQHAKKRFKRQDSAQTTGRHSPSGRQLPSTTESHDDDILNVVQEAVTKCNGHNCGHKGSKCADDAVPAAAVPPEPAAKPKRSTFERSDTAMQRE